MAARIAFADDNLAFVVFAQLKELDDVFKMFVVDILEESELTQHMHHRPELVRVALFPGGDYQIIILGMLELDRAGAAAAADHADRDFVAAFILDNDLGQIAVEDLADSLAEGKIDDGSGDEGVFALIADGNRDACKFEIVTVFIERAGPVFDDSKNYFWKTHYVFLAVKISGADGKDDGILVWFEL
jgi:hypothetical protein